MGMATVVALANLAVDQGKPVDFKNHLARVFRAAGSSAGVTGRCAPRGDG
jgi:hypothetical protein